MGVMPVACKKPGSRLNGKTGGRVEQPAALTPITSALQCHFYPIFSVAEPLRSGRDRSFGDYANPKMTHLGALVE